MELAVHCLGGAVDQGAHYGICRGGARDNPLNDSFRCNESRSWTIARDPLLPLDIAPARPVMNVCGRLISPFVLTVPATERTSLIERLLLRPVNTGSRP